MVVQVPAKKPAQARGGRARRSFDTEKPFVVGDHIQEEVTLSHDVLRIDAQLKYGQLRPLDEAHVSALAAEMRKNRPDKLELTVWREQGVSPWDPGVGVRSWMS